MLRSRETKRLRSNNREVEIKQKQTVQTKKFNFTNSTIQNLFLLNIKFVLSYDNKYQSILTKYVKIKYFSVMEFNKEKIKKITFKNFILIHIKINYKSK